MISERQARKDASNCFRLHKHYYYYSKSKLALDPAYPTIARKLVDTRDPLLDVGCGIALLAAYLRAHSAKMPIRAFDIDFRKIDWARKNLHLKDTEIFHGDARDLPDHSGNIVVLDIVHYFSHSEQVRFLEAIANRLSPGGKAFIRAGIRQRHWRYLATLAEEWIVGFCGWIPRQGWHFPTKEELLIPFEAKGFHIEVRPMWGITPFNSYLFEITRPPVNP